MYRQLKHCHLAVITKSDLVDSYKIAELEKKIREINPVCKLATSIQGKMDYSFLDDDLLLYQWAESEETTNTEETKPKTLFMEIYDDVDKNQLVKFLTEIIPSVYRIKGFLNIKGIGRQQVDVVGTRIDFKESKDSGNAQLVFISKVGPAVIKNILSSWNGNVDAEMKLKN